MSAGTDIAAEVAAALGEAATATGDGPFTATIIRAGEPDKSTYPPTPGADIELPVRALVGSYSMRDRESSLIQAGDIKVMIEAQGTVPKSSDKLRIDGGAPYSIISVAPVQPGGVALYFTVQARR